MKQIRIGVYNPSFKKIDILWVPSRFCPRAFIFPYLHQWYRWSFFLYYLIF